MKNEIRILELNFWVKLVFCNFSAQKVTFTIELLYGLTVSEPYRVV